MNEHTPELSEIDVKIIKFVAAKGPVTLEQISKGLPDISAIKLRVQVLSTPEYSRNRRVPNSSYLLEDTGPLDKDGYQSNPHPGIFQVTDRGRKALEDYKCEVSAHKRELWLQSVWLPILVTIAANIVMALAKALLPVLLERMSG